MRSKFGHSIQIGDSLHYRFVIGSPIEIISTSTPLPCQKDPEKYKKTSRDARHMAQVQGRRLKRQRWHTNYMRSRGKRVGFVVTEVVESSGGLLPEWSAYKIRTFYAIRGPTAV